MNITKRLEAIASLISNNSNIVDVGCDHAYLDIYLTLNRENVTCLACDINKNALTMAKKNIIKYNLKDKIETYLCDGIDSVPVNNNTIIIISGMGTSTVKHILSNDNSKIAKEIIIQSNNDLYELRKYMINSGYYIANEISVYDRNKFYVIIAFKPGIKKYKDKDLIFGPILTKNSNINCRYFKYLLTKEYEIYNKIPFKHINLKIKCLRKIKTLKKIMRTSK